jgi:hypothetical protein
MCGEWHRAEDTAQDALVRVYKAWDRLDHQAGLNTYGNGFLLWYADLKYLDVRDKPIWAVFYDAKGREIARFDSNVYNPAQGYNADRLPVFPK